VTVTNLTGQPAVIVPNGLRGPDSPPAGTAGGGGGAGAAGYDVPAGPPDPGNQSGGPNTPVSITFLGSLYKDDEVLAFASAYQQAAGFLKLHPPSYP
jgi:Asp-tRNA(Asn)/Glu-tRNA(Gln) amidotransferase A subunit family amidase